VPYQFIVLAIKLTKGSDNNRLAVLREPAYDGTYEFASHVALLLHATKDNDSYESTSLRHTKPYQLQPSRSDPAGSSFGVL
jgi:hypothetical protein